MRFISTKEAANDGIKALVYGDAGAGKTTLISTLPLDSTLIISAEGGLLSLRAFDIKGIEVKSLDDVNEAYRFVNEADEARQFNWIAIDSISEIAETVLSYEKGQSADPRQAYGKLIDHMGDLVRAFRDLPGRNVYMSAKLSRDKDGMTGAMLYQPSMPGSKLGGQMPYWFDLVMALRVHRDAEGNEQRALQTQADSQYVAKDRSGALEMWEAPDLGAIARKIAGGAVAAGGGE